MKKWNELSMAEKVPYIKMGIDSGIYNLSLIRDSYNAYADGGQYTVKKGDSLWKISHDNGLSLDELMSYNKQLNGNINTVIHPGDIIYTAPLPRKVHYEYKDLAQVEAEESLANTNNYMAIQSVSHDNNYVIIDKKNRKLSVYNKDNKLLYDTAQINTGLSGNDYNTITYVDENGIIRDMQGNNSTPAGITVISGVGTYHGVPSFTRSRVDNEGNIKKVNGKSDDIASSLHFGRIREGAGSNGCVRVGGKELCELPKYIGIGTKVYTLPEKEGSRFEVRQGRLNYFADNPYGESKGDKRYWDDYNTYFDKRYNPLLIAQKTPSGNYEHDGNVIVYANTLMNGKKQIQEKFNLDSYTYDKLAQLAMGIAEQETKFNTSRRKMIKDYTPDSILNLVRGNSNRSRGATQIKLNGDNQEMQQIYNEFNITEDNIDSMNKSALATISRLAQIYNTEVRGRHFKGKDNKNVSPYDALLYKWMGRNQELRNKTATPEKNIYINNVKKYIRNFEFLTGKEVED